LFGARVKTVFLYYLDNRKAKSKDDVVDLLVADSIKQTLSESRLRHVLSDEGTDWFKPDKLVDVIDTYVNSRLWMPRDVGRSDATTTSLVTNVGNAKGVSGVSKPLGQLKSFASEQKAVVRCWICHQTGHGAYNCKMQGRDSGKTAGTEIRKSPGDKVTVQNRVRTQKPVLYDHVSAPKANAGQTGQTQVNVSHVNIQNCECNMEHHHNFLHAKFSVPIPSLRLPSKEDMAKVDALCRKVQKKNIENYNVMNASEAQNCRNVQVRRCDDQSTVDDEKAQSVTILCRGR